MPRRPRGAVTPRLTPRHTSTAAATSSIGSTAVRACSATSTRLIRPELSRVQTQSAPSARVGRRPATGTSEPARHCRTSVIPVQRHNGGADSSSCDDVAKPRRSCGPPHDRAALIWPWLALAEQCPRPAPALARILASRIDASDLTVNTEHPVRGWPSCCGRPPAQCPDDRGAARRGTRGRVRVAAHPGRVLARGAPRAGTGRRHGPSAAARGRRDRAGRGQACGEGPPSRF